MNDHPLISSLSQLTGEFIASNNPSIGELKQFQELIATVLLQQQPAGEMRQPFQFETLENLSTHHLDAADMEYLNDILKTAEQSVQNAPQIRAFRRQVPFISSQVK